MYQYDYELEGRVHINPSWLYIYRSHGIAGVIIRWIEEGFLESPQYMSEQIVEIMVVTTEVFYVKSKSRDMPKNDMSIGLNNI
ncbi:TetR-like C-terminal domain-containing protein [Bacillus sp. B1-b2]|uniref:TetR-like C-terminal domain-containing protein n=1 Tax=Bacillus sp. B1-b2 TaxID=2653201 RepID=UPI001261610D|nr:TetR-like C-terminal domain-containing protein [Bacillus sp. B1-b2]KAB7672617.1 hypothetical protein F9279_03050 [Bacillus sp. B1-b2]